MEVSALNHPHNRDPRRQSPLLRLQSDEHLIRLVRRGHEDAFALLVERYRARLLAFCRHFLGSAEDAEDALQDVFTSAYNAIRADDRPITVRPWLYRVARNRCLNHLRRTPMIGVDSMDVHLAEHGASTDDKVVVREDFRRLVDDIHALPESQRTALVLREMDALSYEQIAHAMDTSVSSVKSLLVRARMSLAEAAEARLLTCETVRLELAGVAEGLTKRPSQPARRHMRDCESCANFERVLKRNNRTLAALLPLAPLGLLAKLGIFSRAGAGAGAKGGATAGAIGAAGGGAAGVAGLAGGAGAGGVGAAGLAAATTAAVAVVATVVVATSGTHHSPQRVIAVGAPQSAAATTPAAPASHVRTVVAAPSRPATGSRATAPGVGTVSTTTAQPAATSGSTHGTRAPAITGPGAPRVTTPSQSAPAGTVKSAQSSPGAPASKTATPTLPSPTAVVSALNSATSGVTASLTGSLSQAPAAPAHPIQIPTAAPAAGTAAPSCSTGESQTKLGPLAVCLPTLPAPVPAVP